MPLKKIAQLIVPSSLDRLSEVDRFTETAIRSLALPNQMLDDIAITASEAVNNAIVHGNKQDPAKRVKIALYRGSNFLRLIVQDEGPGFSPKSVPDPRLDNNLLKTSGRGLLIIRHLMDRVVYRQLKAGMQIIMDKFYPKG